jgi:hypothetical protein
MNSKIKYIHLCNLTQRKINLLEQMLALEGVVNPPFSIYSDPTPSIYGKPPTNITPLPQPNTPMAPPKVKEQNPYPPYSPEWHEWNSDHGIISDNPFIIQ